MNRIGFTLTNLGTSLHAHQRSIQELMDLGFTDLWSDENYLVDAFTPLALASIWAPRARLGIGVVPAFTRGPAVLAMCAAGLCQAAPGRVVIGVGSSSKVIVEDWNAIPFEKPYGRVRDTLHFLRRALAGEKITEQYETFRVSGFRLGVKVEQQPKLLVGALRSRMLELSGQAGDGAVLNMVSAEDLKKVAPLVKGGGADKEIVCGMRVCPSRDADQVREAARLVINEYVNVPVYAAHQKWLGRGELFLETWKKWKARDRKGAAAAIPDAVVDELVVHGSPEQCREHIQRYLDNGVDTALVDIVPGVLDPMQVARAIAPKG